LYRSPPARKGRGEEAEPDPAVSSFSPAAAREPTPPTVAVALGEDAPPLSCCSRNPAEHCSGLQKGFPDCVGVVIVIFVYLF